MQVEVQGLLILNPYKYVFQFIGGINCYFYRDFKVKNVMAGEMSGKSVKAIRYC